MADLSRDAERMRKNRRIGLSVAAVVFLLDQAVKWVVTYPLQLPHRLTIEILPFFTLRWLKNTGVSMGLLTADSDLGRWLLVALTCAIAAFVAFWMWREKRRDDAIALWRWCSAERSATSSTGCGWAMSSTMPTCISATSIPFWSLTWATLPLPSASCYCWSGRC